MAPDDSDAAACGVCGECEGEGGEKRKVLCKKKKKEEAKTLLFHLPFYAFFSSPSLPRESRFVPTHATTAHSLCDAFSPSTASHPLFSLSLLFFLGAFPQ